MPWVPRITRRNGTLCMKSNGRASPIRQGGAQAPAHVIARGPSGARPRAAERAPGTQGSYGVGTIWGRAGRLVAAGPGRAARLFRVAVLGAGMPEAAASVAPV